MILLAFSLLLNPAWALEEKSTASIAPKSNFFFEEKLDFKKDKNLDIASDLKSEAVVKRNSKTNSLISLKELEHAKKWKECQELAPTVIRNEVSVKHWILQTWSICAGKAQKEVSTAKNVVLKPFEFYEKNKSSIESSAAWKTLRPELLKNIAYYIDNSLKTDSKSMSSWIQKYFQLAEEKENKARALGWSGELAQIHHQLAAAESFYDQSLQLVENKTTREKLISVRLALNIKKDDVPAQKTEYLSEAEQKFEDRFKATLKNNDLIALMDDSINYLAQFPNGKRAKWCFEKVQDIYQNFADKAGDKNGDEKYISLREKALEHLEKMEANRLLEVARSLHRRGDFSGALRLTEKAYGPLSQSPQAGLVLFVMGRCAQFTGDYKKARKYFEQYVEFHSAGEEIGEVQFRLALVHYRLAQYSSAVAVLERLILSKTGDRYDLLGRYWLVRSLQAIQNPRVQEETKILLEKYPLSYYGLRLRAEKQNQSLDPWPLMASEDNLSESVFWANFQKPIWDRVLLLGQNGWTGEALAELAELTFSSNAKIKTLLAQRLVHNKIYSPAIKMIMDSLDQNPELQTLDIISISLPMAYDDAISAQARKYSLNPLLVRSLIRQESAFNERATSVSKAMGLMQLIPPTALEVAQDLGLQGLDLPQDSYLPQINIQMGTSYIARMIKQFGGNIPLGLAAYNAGPTKMNAFIRARPEIQEMTTRMSSEPNDEIWFDELPWNETSFYVKAILRNTILYRLKSGDKVTLLPVLWSDLRLVQ